DVEGGDVDDLQRRVGERLASALAGLPPLTLGAVAEDSKMPMWEDPHPYPQLHEAALYGLAGEVVRMLDPHTEADPAAVLLTFLTMFGNAVGDGPHVRVGGVRHPARLFSTIAGKTAVSRKGQGYADAGRCFEHADPFWWERSRISGLGSGEGLINALRDG